jgi:hypothetical protein
MMRATALLLLVFILSTSSLVVADDVVVVPRGIIAWLKKKIQGLKSPRVLPVETDKDVISKLVSEADDYVEVSSKLVVEKESTPAVSANQDGECLASNRECVANSPSLSSVFVIGDIHGDAICAISWVIRAGLVSNLLNDDAIQQSTSSIPLYKQLNDPSKWIWTNDNASLVFMGDYVDKGPTARQTVEFVRDLTIAFPTKVTAILGNHELELLRDRDVRILPHERYSSYSYATVHPGDYHNYIDGARDLDEKDHLVLDQLYEATMEVYAHRAHAAVRVIPSLPDHIKARSSIKYAITDLMPPNFRSLAGERLTEYQDAYLNTFRSGTPLGSWLEKRPIVHLADEIKTLFVHGGVSHDIGLTYFSNATVGVEKINSHWWANSNEDKLLDFMRGTNSGEDSMGSVVYELLTYRGNHPGYGQWESHGTFDEGDTDDTEVCQTLHTMLSKMEGIDRIAVGHTPEDGIRISCDGRFLALDSTLGRWIRGTGNEYCPGPEHFENRKGVDIPRSSRNGKYTCDEVKEVCEGQIVRLDSDGSVNILTMV